jgi:hypothetical protein
MVARYVPGDAAVNVHDPVTVPPGDRVTLEEQEAVRPDGTATARFAGPDSPERLVRLTVLLPEEPAVNEVDDAEMLKSITVTCRAIE